MANEEILKKFEEKMEKELPGYKTFLDEETINGLLKDFEKRESFSKTAAFCLDKYLSSSSIDYENDYNKANEKMAIAGENFKSKISMIKEEYNIASKEEVDSYGK